MRRRRTTRRRRPPRPTTTTRRQRGAAACGAADQSHGATATASATSAARSRRRRQPRQRLRRQRRVDAAVLGQVRRDPRPRSRIQARDKQRDGLGGRQGSQRRSPARRRCRPGAGGTRTRRRRSAGRRAPNICRQTRARRHRRPRTSQRRRGSSASRHVMASASIRKNSCAMSGFSTDGPRVERGVDDTGRRTRSMPPWRRTRARAKTNVSHSVAAAKHDAERAAGVDDARVAQLAGDESQHDENHVEDEMTVRSEGQRKGVVRRRAAQQVELEDFVGGECLDEARVRRRHEDERHEARAPQGGEQTGEDGAVGAETRGQAPCSHTS